MDVIKVLTVAGSDSGGGAGIQADLKTFCAYGVYGSSVITALTAQNTIGVQAIHIPEPEFISAQLNSLFTDISFSAVKTGMIPSVEIIKECADAFRRHQVKNLIVDPVMVATSGDKLAGGEEWLETFKRELIPLATVVTPNVPEACRLTGRNIVSEMDMRHACLDIADLGCKNVVVKGGHRFFETRDVDDDLKEQLVRNAAVDVLYDGISFHAFAKPWLDIGNTHGTGCTLASAIAAEIAMGNDVCTAVQHAKDYVFNAMRYGFRVGEGHGVLNHMYALKTGDLSKVNT